MIESKSILQRYLKVFGQDVMNSMNWWHGIRRLNQVKPSKRADVSDVIPYDVSWLGCTLCMGKR